MVIAGDQNSRNPNLQVAFAHAWYVFSHSIGRSLRMNGMHRTQSDNSRVRKGSWILEICPVIFHTWKMGIKSGNMIKSLDFFFFERYSKCFISGVFFVLVKPYSISPVLLQRVMKKKLCFCVFLKVPIDHLCDNLESGKRKLLFLKKVSKILHPKIWTNLACVQTSPLPHEKSGEESLPIFTEGGGTSVHRLNEPCNSRFDLLSRRSCRHSPTFGK